MFRHARPWIWYPESRSETGGLISQMLLSVVGGRHMHQSAVQVAERPTIEDSFASESALRRGWTLFIACAGVALVIASMIALNTALSDIALATRADQTQLTWIVDSYTLVLACLLLPAGAVGDRYGRRSALMVGLAIFGAASFAPLVFGSPLQIIAARAVAG